jgi:hypothetical protein
MQDEIDSIKETLQTCTVLSSDDLDEEILNRFFLTGFRACKFDHLQIF